MKLAANSHGWLLGAAVTLVSSLSLIPDTANAHPRSSQGRWYRIMFGRYKYARFPTLGQAQAAHNHAKSRHWAPGKIEYRGGRYGFSYVPLTVRTIVMTPEEANHIRKILQAYYEFAEVIPFNWR